MLATSIQPLLAQSLPGTAEQPATPEPAACELTISGTVLDHDSREPLVGATVYIPQLDKATVADQDGHYHFQAICQGSYTLKVTYVGYEPITAAVRINSSMVRDLPLHPDTRTLSTVEVTGTRIQAQAQATQTLQGRELEQTRGLSLGESLKSIAGVTTLQTGPSISKPVIHGLHSNRVLILNNGVRQEGQQWGAEHAPEIDPFVASEMKVIKGAAGVRYGADAIGGVVIVEPKPLRDSAGVGGELNLVGSTNNRQATASATIEGNFAKVPPLSWRLQGTFKRAGNTRTPDYYLDNTALKEKDFSAAVGYQQKDYGVTVFYSQFDAQLGILSASHVGNLDDWQSAIERGRPAGADSAGFSYDINRPYQNVLHQLLKARAYLNTGNAGKLEFTYGWQQNRRQEFDFVGLTSGRPSLDLDLTTNSTETVWTPKPLGNFTGSVGVSTMFQNNAYAGGRFFIPDYTNLDLGAFALEKWQKDKLQLEAGLRYDYKHLSNIKRWQNGEILDYPAYTFNNLSGTLGALYDVGYHLTLGLSATSAWRAPGVNELFSDGLHEGIYTIGNPDLESEQAYNLEASAEYYGSPRFNGKLSVYNNLINNYVYQVPDEPTQTINGFNLTYRYKQANAVLRGMDLSLQYKLLGNLTLDSKTAIVRARNIAADDYLIGIPADRFDNSLQYDFGSVGSSKKLTGTYLSVGGQYVAQQTRMPVKYDTDIAPAPAGYFLLHAEAGTTLHLGRQTIDVGITGNNLLDTSYRDYLNRFRYFTEEMGRMFMFRVKVPLEFTKS